MDLFGDARQFTGERVATTAVVQRNSRKIILFFKKTVKIFLIAESRALPSHKFVLHTAY